MSKRRTVATKSGFIGQVRTEWLIHAGDDRKMRLLEPFAFIDAQGLLWEAPAGEVIDGASIPRFLWVIAGSPFAGEYRRATVLHDAACHARSRLSRDVHRMFYEAMKADGVKESIAQKFYAAVRMFGPNWGAKRTASQRTFKQVEASLDVILG